MSAEKVIAEHWPYDGPHDPERTAEAAMMIAELVRYLNNATGQSDALPDVQTLCTVLGEWETAIYRLPQLLGQLARFAEGQAADPTLYDDRRGRHTGQSTARELAASLEEERDAIGPLQMRLEEAHALASHLGNEMGE